MDRSGIIRRIDDLGRIVIPKEIRQSMRIEAGDPIEIIPNRKEGIILRKYHASAINTDIIDDIIDDLNDAAYYANDIANHDKFAKIAKITETLTIVKKLIIEAGY